MEQEEKQTLTVPAIVFEAEAERSDRRNKRMWLVIIGLIAILIGLVVAMVRI